MAKELGIDVSSISDEESKASTQDDKPIAKKKIRVSLSLRSISLLKKGFSNVVLTAISQGLLWAIMAIGVFITFRILDLADLTAEGAFPLVLLRQLS